MKFLPKKCSAIVAGLLVSVALTGASTAVKAASIFIDAANLSNQTAFNFGQFEGGFSINGSTPITTGGAVFPRQTPLNFTGQWIDLGAATAFARTVYWINPKFPTRIRDILQWSITPSGQSGLATISGFFNSALDDLTNDLGSLPMGVSPSDIIIEQKNGSHDPFNFSAAFLGGQVITGAALPEPGTLAILGLGLAGLVYARRRKTA